MEFVQHITTLLVLVGGAFFAADRIRKEFQHRLRIGLYDEMRGPLRNASTLLNRAATTAESISRTYDLLAKGVGLEISLTASDLSGAHLSASDALSEVLYMIDEYEIVFESPQDVHDRIISRVHEFHNAFGAMSSKAQLFLRLPPEIEERIGEHPPLPMTSDPADLELLRGLIGKYASVCRDLAGYVYDIRREAQTLLLGPLFRKSLDPRVPGDPDVDVLIFRH
ncbi:MAG: hypothetical protein ACREX3_14040 [Gammaproteobacteria bacterium]